MLVKVGARGYSASTVRAQCEHSAPGSLRRAPESSNAAEREIERRESSEIRHQISGTIKAKCNRLIEAASVRWKLKSQKVYLHVQKLAQSDVRNAGGVLAEQMHRWIEDGGIDRLKIFTKHCSEREKRVLSLWGDGRRRCKIVFVFSILTSPHLPLSK